MTLRRTLLVALLATFCLAANRGPIVITGAGWGGQPLPTPTPTASGTPTASPTPTATPTPDPNVLMAEEDFETGTAACDDNQVDHPDISADSGSPACDDINITSGGETYSAKIDDTSGRQYILFGEAWDETASVVCDFLLEFDLDPIGNTSVQDIFATRLDIAVRGPALEMDGNDAPSDEAEIHIETQSGTRSTLQDLTSWIDNTYQFRIAWCKTVTECDAMFGPGVDVDDNGDVAKIWVNTVGANWNNETDPKWVETVDGTNSDYSVDGFWFASSSTAGPMAIYTFDNVSCCETFPADPTKKCGAP